MVEIVAGKTTIETESHLLRCLVYIDLNMVRTGIVSHPSEWPFSGYHEIQFHQHTGGLIAVETSSLSMMKDGRKEMWSKK
jgi:putative transposase